MIHDALYRSSYTFHCNFDAVITGRNVTVTVLLLLVCNVVEPAYVIIISY